MLRNLILNTKEDQTLIITFPDFLISQWALKFIQQFIFINTINQLRRTILTYQLRPSQWGLVGLLPNPNIISNLVFLCQVHQKNGNE